MKFKNKRLIVFFSTLVLILLFILIYFFNAEINIFNNFRDNSIILEINNENVTYKEFMESLLYIKSDIYSYFKEKYNVDDNTNFWTASYGQNKEIPTEKAKQVCFRKNYENKNNSNYG